MIKKKWNKHTITAQKHAQNGVFLLYTPPINTLKMVIKNKINLYISDSYAIISTKKVRGEGLIKVFLVNMETIIKWKSFAEFPFNRERNNKLSYNENRIMIIAIIKTAEDCFVDILNHSAGDSILYDNDSIFPSEYKPEQIKFWIEYNEVLKEVL